MSSTQRRLLGSLHRETELRNRGSSLHASLSEGTTWCHGDARTNNVVVGSRGLPLLIDWECAGLGRPEADLGALCGSLITDALVPIGAPRGGEARVELVAAIETAATQIRTVLSAYRSLSKDTLDPHLLGGAVACCLLARAFLRAALTGQDRIVAALHAVGRSLLAEPVRWRAIDG